MKIQIVFIENFPSIQEGIFYLTGISKSQLKKFHFKKNFLDKPINKGDEVSFPANLINHGKVNPTYDGPEINVIYEDENLIALSKPFKLHSHPQSYMEGNNLLSGMYHLKRDKELSVNKESYDRGLLYRLDFETSGLMIYIKKDEILKEMREHFHEQMKKKYYLAVVHGNLASQKLSHHLRPFGEKGAKMIEASDGVLNEIEVEHISYNSDKDVSLVKVNLGHGHRHQIRAQLACAHHPILGDHLYGRPEEDRLYLHCYQYQFVTQRKEYDLRDDSIKDLTKFFNLNRKF